ncbi:MAG: hypothetical protein H3C53_02460 [Trueperaceae bacterium]|nr:hypothetical protein [Trueperaceae bacterium]
MTFTSSHGTGRGARLAAAAALACLATVLASCRPQDQLAPGSVDRVGVVLLTQAHAGAAAGQATFVALGTARAERLLAEPFGEQLGTCRVASAAAPGTGPASPAAGGNRLLAGDPTLHVGGSTYASLTRDENDRYHLAGATGPLPAALTVDIAATGGFPAFAGVPVDTGSEPVVAPGFDANGVTVDTVFGWTPTTGKAAVLLVGSSGGVSYSCLADDSLGAFVFPDATRQELVDAGFATGTLDTLGRITTTQARSGSALLMVNTLRLAYPGSL